MKTQTAKLPETPGVYFFVGKNKKLLYIGKATSLKSRVRSYFVPDIGEKRSPLIKKMVGEAVDIKCEQTDSVLEALILEAELIKKHQPPYNTANKDQKSWNYVVITDEDFPRILVLRERELKSNIYNLKSTFGPFTNSSQLKEALKIIRKIFPFRDKCQPVRLVPRSSSKARSEVGCFNYQLGLCPGTCIGAISKQEYAKTIRNIVLFFKGEKRVLIKTLKQEMKALAKNREFEKAAKIKSKIFALQHIHDIALIKNEKFQISNTKRQTFRIEAYDIAHLSGESMVGVMVVLENGEIKKSEYRKFKVKNQKSPDDARALKEILERRFKHAEWSFPNLIVVDGGVAQLNVGESVLKNLDINIPIVAVTKDEKHKPVKIQTTNHKYQTLIDKYKKEILLANSEAHRFAIRFHQKRRGRAFLPDIHTP